MAQHEPLARVEARLPMDGQEETELYIVRFCT
jgi:hypothetical protein